MFSNRCLWTLLLCRMSIHFLKSVSRSLYVSLWAGHFYLIYTTRSEHASLFNQAPEQWFMSLSGHTKQQGEQHTHQTITLNWHHKRMAVTPTCADHAGLVSHYAVTSHHALLLLWLHESVWACGPYGVL